VDSGGRDVASFYLLSDLGCFCFGAKMEMDICKVLNGDFDD
jgi:hypothetical protein